MAMTPEQWLDRLSMAMDRRAPRIALLRSYMDGCAPLPEGAEGCRDAYKAFQKKARTNFGELAVEAVAERVIPSGIRIGQQQQDDDAARAIWKRNRMQTGFADVLRDMLGLSVGYMMVSESAPREAMISFERPEQCITDHDARRPDLVRAGLKTYCDPVEALDYAYLHTPGVVSQFTRPAVSVPDAYASTDLRPRPMGVSGGWKFQGSASSGLDVVPIVPFVNRGGLGEFESHIDVLDRINWTVLQKLVIIAIQAFRQRGVKGDLPAEDAEGNEIDYAEMFKPGPGALWQLPEGVDIWESGTTDVTPILASVKDDLRDFAAVTRTPMSTLMPDSANQSAEGAASMKEGLVFKAQDRRDRAGSALELVTGIALAIERGQRSPVLDVEQLFMPVERQSLQERADAATKAQDLPWRTRMTDIWQFSDERVDQLETERAADMLNQALIAPPQANSGNGPAAA